MAAAEEEPPAPAAAEAPEGSEVGDPQRVDRPDEVGTVRLASTGGAYNLDDEEWEVHRLVNAYRRSLGLPALALSPRLSRAALCRSGEMAEYDYFSHDTRRCGAELDAYWETGARLRGENIARGHTSAEQVVRAWRESPGHDRNLREGRYRAHGIQRVQSGDGRWYWTHLFGDVSDEDGRVRFRCPELTRAAGPDRYATAAAISRVGFAGGASTVVIASGSDAAPDALAAAPLAHRLSAPILLTAPESLPAPTAEEIGRLGAGHAIIVGGEGAVSAGVASTLASRGLTVERIAGGDRYDTAARIARRAGASGGLAVVASGEGAHLVDALAAGGAAAALGAPVLLVSRDALPASTADALRDLGITRTVVAGGPAAVSDAVVGSLPSPRRVAGASRYATAAALAEWARTEGVRPESILVARGDRTPDALASGALGRIVLLSPSHALASEAERFIGTYGTDVTLLGGDSALGADVESGSCAALY